MSGANGPIQKYEGIDSEGSLYAGFTQGNPAFGVRRRVYAVEGVGKTGPVVDQLLVDTRTDGDVCMFDIWPLGQSQGALLPYDSEDCQVALVLES